MRGTLIVGHDDDAHGGIIPAYAGNTGSYPRVAWFAGDHPRVCGEHTLTGKPRSTCKGSSPRMRGTLICILSMCDIYRIIPAYAGNTAVVSVEHLHTGDHPRVCGEHRSRPWPLYPTWGSSPRMRGTRLTDSDTPKVPGIIPAYAGNTLWQRYVTRSDWDHPRVCGEHI